jgi:hypothetical protein
MDGAFSFFGHSECNEESYTFRYRDDPSVPLG